MTTFPNEEAYYAVLQWEFGEEIARRLTRHELYHRETARRKGGDSDLMLAHWSDPSGKLDHQPFCISKFPSTLPQRKKDKIAEEITGAPPDLSDGDLEALHELRARRRRPWRRQ